MKGEFTSYNNQGIELSVEYHKDEVPEEEECDIEMEGFSKISSGLYYHQSNDKVELYMRLERDNEEWFLNSFLELDQLKSLVSQIEAIPKRESREILPLFLDYWYTYRETRHRIKMILNDNVVFYCEEIANPRDLLPGNTNQRCCFCENLSPSESTFHF